MDKLSQWLEAHKHLTGQHNQKLHGNRGAKVSNALISGLSQESQKFYSGLDTKSQVKFRLAWYRQMDKDPGGMTSEDFVDNFKKKMGMGGGTAAGTTAAAAPKAPKAPKAAPATAATTAPTPAPAASNKWIPLTPTTTAALGGNAKLWNNWEKSLSASDRKRLQDDYEDYVGSHGLAKSTLGFRSFASNWVKNQNAGRGEMKSVLDMQNWEKTLTRAQSVDFETKWKRQESTNWTRGGQQAKVDKLEFANNYAQNPPKNLPEPAVSWNNHMDRTHYTNDFQIKDGKYKPKSNTPIEVFVETGWKKTNAYYGSSQISIKTYSKSTFGKGDVIEILPGGYFLLKGGKGPRIPVRFTDPPTSAMGSDDYGRKIPVGVLDFLG